jgi:hypothetical protein
LYRLVGEEIFVGNRNPNRKQFKGTEWMNSQGGIREAVATRHDLYSKGAYHSDSKFHQLPKYYLMTLGEVQRLAETEEGKFFADFGIDMYSMTEPTRKKVFLLIKDFRETIEKTVEKF